MKKSTISYSLVFVGILFASTALAQATIPAGNVLKQQAINRCAVIENNVSKRLMSFEKQKLKQAGQYEKARKRAVALVTKLEDEGYEVSQLKADLVTFNDKVKKFSEDYTTYIADLNDTKAYTCGRSEGEFKAKLLLARAQLKVVHDDAVAIRTFWSQTIKPQIELLKTTTPITSTVEGSN